MKTFEELREKIHSECNTNFHFDQLDWATKVRVRGLCDIIDEKLVAPDPYCMPVKFGPKQEDHKIFGNEFPKNNE